MLQQWFPTNNGVSVLLLVDQPPLVMLNYKDDLGGNTIYQLGIMGGMP